MQNPKYLFRPNELVILFDCRERNHMFALKEAGVFESHSGNLNHSQVIGAREGTWFKTTTGHRLNAFRPTRSEHSMNMPRIAPVIYPKDIGPILTCANIS